MYKQGPTEREKILRHLTEKEIRDQLYSFRDRAAALLKTEPQGQAQRPAELFESAKEEVSARPGIFNIIWPVVFLIIFFILGWVSVRQVIRAVSRAQAEQAKKEVRKPLSPAKAQAKAKGASKTQSKY